MAWPIIAAAVIGAAGSAIAGKQGQIAQQKAIDQAREELEKRYGRLDAIPVPVLEQLSLQAPELVGQLAPMLSQEQLTQLGPSSMEKVTTDPRFRQSQMDALARLGEISKEGITPTERLAMEQIRQRQARESQGQQQAILQNLAQRGISGGGQEMALRAQAQQSAANQAAMEGMQLSAEQRARALQALIQKGEMAGQIRSQEFGEQSDRAKAADEIARWNAAMRAGVEQRRVQTRNQALADDLAARQAIANQKADIANQQQMYNKNIPVKSYEMEVAKATGQLPMAGDLSKLYGQQGQLQSGMWGGIGKGIGQISDAWAKSYTEDNKKEEKEE